MFLLISFLLVKNLSNSCLIKIKSFKKIIIIIIIKNASPHPDSKIMDSVPGHFTLLGLFINNIQFWVSLSLIQDY